MINKITKLFEGHKNQDSNIPDIDNLIEEAEQTPANIPKNEVPESIEPLYNSISGLHNGNTDKVFTMEDIEKTDALFAHTLKLLILQKLVSEGFKVKEPTGMRVRFGKRMAYNYYFLNMNKQGNLKEKIKTIILGKVEYIEKSDITRIEMQMDCEVRSGFVRTIAFEVILGSVKVTKIEA